MANEKLTKYEELLEPLLGRLIHVNTFHGRDKAVGILEKTPYGYCLQSQQQAWNRLHLQTSQVYTVSESSILLRNSERIREDCRHFVTLESL